MIRASARAGTGVAGCLLLIVGLVGCGGASLRLQSVATNTSLGPDLPVRVYRYEDGNTADLYLSNLPEDALTAPAALNREEMRALTGVLVHIHLFLTPSAANTPIASTASNTTVRYYLFVRGEVGVYGGGGFLLPSRQPGATSYSGDMKGASLRLLQATPGFRDALGASELAGAVQAQLDDRRAGLIASFIERVMRAADLSPPDSDENAQGPTPPDNDS